MRKILLHYPKVTGKGESKPLYSGIPLSVLSLAAQVDPAEYEIRVIDGRFEEFKLARAKENNVRLQAEFVSNDRNRMLYVAYKFAEFKEIFAENNFSILENDLSHI